MVNQLIFNIFYFLFFIHFIKLKFIYIKTIKSKFFMHIKKNEKKRFSKYEIQNFRKKIKKYEMMRSTKMDDNCHLYERT